MTEPVNLSMTIRLERDDTIPAFGGFLRCEAEHDENILIYVNVEASMCPYFGEDVLSEETIKRNLIETIMHEFGHALESHFRIPVNEEAIHEACNNWKSHFDTLPEGRQAEITPSECFDILSQDHPTLIRVIEAKIEKKHCATAAELASSVGNRDDSEMLSTLILGASMYLWNKAA